MYVLHYVQSVNIKSDFTYREIFSGGVVGSTQKPCFGYPFRQSTITQVHFILDRPSKYRVDLSKCCRVICKSSLYWNQILKIASKTGYVTIYYYY